MIIVILSIVVALTAMMWWVSATWLKNTTGKNSAYEVKKTFKISWESHFLNFKAIVPTLMFIGMFIVFPIASPIFLLLIFLPNSRYKLDYEYWIKATKGITLTLDPADKSITINGVAFYSQDIDCIEKHFSTTKNFIEYAYYKIILKNGQYFLLNQSLIPTAFEHYNLNVPTKFFKYPIARIK